MARIMAIIMADLVKNAEGEEKVHPLDSRGLVQGRWMARMASKKFHNEVFDIGNHHQCTQITQPLQQVKPD